MKNIPWHTKFVLALMVFMPIFFVVAALGTKFGIWGWMTGLLALTFGAGPFLLLIMLVVAIGSLVAGLLKKPRRRGVIAVAIAGILLPGGILVGFGSAANKATGNPIHDVATDTATPPPFSAETMAARQQSGANTLIDYQQPLGETEMFAGSPPELKIKSQAQIITNTYANLAPLPLGGASKADAVAAVAAAMGNMGLSDISTDIEAGRVEGVAETFWFGFEDDVVARVGEQQIDFRSVSRVGQSDLGANAARIAELRDQVAAQIGQR